MSNIELISYGSIAKDFKVMAQLTKLLAKVKNGEVTQNRVDCYNITSQSILDSIIIKFKDVNLDLPISSEIFLPSTNYPSHIDEGGISYFIPLEEGKFLIGGVFYPIVPFVLYAFEDSKPHNTNFGAIMLK